MRIEPWRSLPDAGSHRWAEWSDLALGAGNIFGTPEFATIWWRHLGRGEPRILACRSDDGRLVALWPLYRRRIGGLRMLRAIGHGCGDELSLVCRPPDRADSLAGLVEAFDSGPSETDVLALDHVPVDASDLPDGESTPGWSLRSPGWDRIDHQVLFAEQCPLLVAPPGGWEELLASRSRNFRQQVRRRERRLFRDHDVEVHLTHDLDELSSGMEEQFRLHRLRFDQRESNAFDASHRRFHREWAATCLERGWLRLWTLRVDDDAVAAWYGFRFAEVESFYQSGRDPGWEAESVGFVLLAHTVRAALDDGVREYRFLRGGESYKGRFADAMAAVATVAVPRTALGRAAVAIGRTLRRRSWSSSAPPSRT